MNTKVITLTKHVQFNTTDTLEPILEETLSVGHSSTITKRFDALDVESNEHSSYAGTPVKPLGDIQPNHTGLTPIMDNIKLDISANHLHGINDDFNLYQHSSNNL